MIDLILLDIFLRHEKYETQYRGEKAVNCRIKTDSTLVFVNNKLGAKTDTNSTEEEYFAVVCSDCNTTVGVKQANGSDQNPYIYFFQVIPSQA
jgi:hypothetical protein